MAELSIKLSGDQQVCNKLKLILVCVWTSFCTKFFGLFAFYLLKIDKNTIVFNNFYLLWTENFIQQKENYKETKEVASLSTKLYTLGGQQPRPK